MNSNDSLGRNLLTGKIALAGTLLLAGPALADDRVSFKEFRLANPGVGRQELRQQFRADRIEARELRQELRGAGNAGGPHVEFTPFCPTPNVITPKPISLTPTTTTTRNAGLQNLSNRSTYVTDKGRTRNISRGLELDLTSNHRAIVLGENLFAGASSYTVNVGGEQKVLSSGSRVTAAEFIALQQVIDGGAQTLVVDQSGRGVDGSFTLASIDDAGRNINARSLTVSEGVDAVGNFGRNGDFTVGRELINYGNIYALSNNAANTKANIGARDVTNAASGTITSVTPDLVAAANGAIDAPIDLRVQAARDLSNLGSISSSGSVTLAAGKTLTNSGSVSAHADVNLLSSAVVNTGSIAANAGNVNFDTELPSSISVDNTGGTISALNGAINFRTNGFTPKVDTTVSGGDWYSQTVNLNGGDGHVGVKVHEITGVVNTYAGTAAIVADTANLTIGETVTSGDPLIENSGNVNLTLNQTTGGGPLTVIAGQNITIASGLTFDTSNTGNGGDILFIAGALYTGGGGGPVTITGASATGGSITFSGTAPVFDASSSSANGGDITFAAFQGSSAGSISLGGATITSTGASGFSNGTVSMFANNMTVGTVNVNGAGTNNTAGTGNIVLAGGQPQIVGTLVIDAAGNVTSGSLAPGSPTGTVVTAIGALDAKNLVSVSAGTTNVAGASINSGSLAISSSGTININSPWSVSGSLTLLTSQNIDIRASITAPGGILMVAGEEIAVIAPSTAVISSSAAGQGGDITMVSGASFTQTGTTVTITGASNTSDIARIDLGSSLSDLDSRGTGLNASGGNITLVAYASVNRSDAGTVGFGTSLQVRSGGTGTGDNGNIVIVAGLNGGGNNIGFGNNVVVNTGGATDNGTGDVTLHTATPVDGVTLSKLNGGIATGSFLGGATVNGGILLAASSTIQTNGGDIDIRAGRVGSNQAIDLGTIAAMSGAVRVASTGATSDIQTRLIQGGSIVVTSLQDINLRGDGWSTETYGGGILAVAGRNVLNIDTTTALDTTEGAGGPSGAISLIAGALFTEDTSSITITGPSTTGGNVDITQMNAITTDGLTGASGGDINVIAYKGTALSERGGIFTSGDLILSTAGDGAGSNGDVIFMGGAEGGVFNIGGNWDTAGGATGTGSVLIRNYQPITGASLSKITGDVLSIGFTNGATDIGAANINFTNNNFTLIADTGSQFTSNAGGETTLTNTSISAGRIRISSVESNNGIGNLTTFGNGTVVVTSQNTVALRGDIVAPGGVVIVAGNVIESLTAGASINTSVASGNAGDVVLVAGATFSDPVADPVTLNITGSSNLDNVSINLGNTFTGIDTRSLAGNGAGGDVTLLRMTSTGSFTGGVFVQGGGTSILTGGSGTGANGNITIVSGRNGSNAISLDAAIDTTGGAVGTGDVLLQTTAPANATIVQSNASVTGFLGGAYTDSAIVQSNGQGGITMAGGSLIVNAGNAITMQGVTNPGGDVQYNGGRFGSVSTVNVKGITAASISVTSAGLIDMRGGDMVGSDGILFVAGGDIQNNGAAMSITTAGATNRGDITLVAGAQYTLGANSVTIAGATASGGNVGLGNGFAGLDSSSTAGIGDAGDITLVAYAGTAGNNGVVVSGAASFFLNAGGSGSGENGDVLVISSRNDGGNGIELTGSIDIKGGVTGTGSVTLQTSAVGTNVTLDVSTASETSGNFQTSATRNSNIRLTGANSIVTDGSDVTILSGRNARVASISTTPDAIGDAGTISFETNGAELLQIGANTENSIGALSFNGGLVSGAGGTLNVLNRGSNGIQINGSVLQQNQNVGAGGNITIDSDAGTLSFANGPVVIEASGEGGTPQDGGSITLRANAFNFNGLNVDLRANASLGGGTAGSVTIETNGALSNILGTGANQFEVQVGSAGEDGSLTLSSVNSTVGLTSAVTVDNLTLSAATGITQTGSAVISTNHLTINLASGVADLTTADNAVGRLNATGGGTIQLDNDAATSIILNSLGSSQSLVLTALNGVMLTGNITTSGDIDIITTGFTAQANMTANSIDVSSPVGAGGLFVNGDTANATFNATGVGQLVRFTANDGDLDLAGNQTYVSNAELEVVSPTGALNVLALADIEGLQTLRAISENYNFVGSIVGNPLILNSNGVGTIANSQGDVTLSGNIVLNGSFAIIALGDVNAGTATQIDLTGPSGAGSLTVLAGFDFDPPTGGQVGPVGNETVTYTGIMPSAIGGDINFSGVTITTAGGAGTGGDVTLIASDGTQNVGNITVGNVNASGTTGGGNVRIIGPGNITTGEILANGANGGDILVSTTAPVVTGTPSILNGVLSGGGFNPGNPSQDKKSGSLVINGLVDASGTGGSITLTSNSTKNFVIGGTKKVKNGVLGGVIAGAGNVLTITNVRGGVQVEGSNPVAASTIELNAGGKGALVTGKGVVLNAATMLTLSAETGNIGKKVFAFNSARVNADTAGNISLNSQGTAPLLVDDAEVGGNFTLTAAGGVTLNDVTTTKGSIAVTAATGVLDINDGSVLTANNGALTLINSDIISGSIDLGANTTIETQGKGKDVNIAIGAPPKKPTNTTPPAGVTVNNTGKGQSFFSAAGGFNVIGSNETRGTNKDVIINNGSTGTQKITFGGNVVVEADPPTKAAVPMMPALISQSSDNGQSITSLVLRDNSGLISNIGSALNAQSVAAIPTDLLSSATNSANSELKLTTADMNQSNVAFASQSGETGSSAYDYMTDAFVWSDEDLGIGSASMLKGESSGTNTGVSVAGVVAGTAGTEIAKLRKGTLVLAPSRNTRLETPMGTIEVSKGSVALVVLDDTRLGVYDLHDEKKGSIRVSNGGKSMTLSPGRCTVLTTKAHHGFEYVNPMESIGYKSVAAVRHGNGVKAFNAEFATMHAIGSVKPLMQIVGSKHDNARRMSNKLMKTSAVLMHLSNGGEFKVYAEPSVTAMNR